MSSRTVATTLAALARIGVPPGETLPAATPALSLSNRPAAPHQGALPSQAGAAANGWDDIVSSMNAERGLRPGANPGGRGAATAGAAARPTTGAASPDELADMVNAEHGVRAGANVPPALAAHFANLARDSA